MHTIQQLREQRATVWDQMEAITALADTEKRDITADERAEYDRLEAQFDQLKDSIEHAEKRERNRLQATAADYGDTPAAEQAKQPQSLGAHFLAEAGEKVKNTQKGSRWSISTPEFHNAATDTIGTDGVQIPTIDTNVVTEPRRALITDLLDQGQIDSNALTYFVEGEWEGDFAAVAEDGHKPQMKGGFTSRTDALKKIAGFIKESDEMVEDLAFLKSSIDGRLIYKLLLAEEAQVLSGSGVGANLEGILNRSGVQTLGASTDPAAGNSDQLFKASMAVSTGSGLLADGVVLNPADYQALRLAKDANEQYYGGGPFSGAYGNGGVILEPPLWGLRTVVSPGIAQGTALVGSFKQAATLYGKGGVRVEMTNSNDVDFEYNRVTIRAEVRRLLAVRVPAGFVKVTLGAA